MIRNKIGSKLGKIKIVKGVLYFKNLISIGVKFGIYYGSGQVLKSKIQICKIGNQKVLIKQFYIQSEVERLIICQKCISTCFL